MASVGLGPSPLRPEDPFPFGTGFGPAFNSIPISTASGTFRMNSVNFTCAGCHVGRVAKADGTVQLMIGAPSYFDVSQYEEQLLETVIDPDYTFANFELALSLKPPGWLYGDEEKGKSKKGKCKTDENLRAQEEVDRLTFLADGVAILEGIREATLAKVDHINRTLDAYTYNVPNPPDKIGGVLDVFGGATAGFVDPDVLTPEQLKAMLAPAPAPTDVMSVWRQDDRLAFQWDHSIGNLTYRIVQAELTQSGGQPGSINMENLAATGRFTIGLPSPPYPFDVARASTRRGAKVWKQACAGCHFSDSLELFTPEVTGTDGNRVNAITDTVVQGTIALARAVCTDPVLCFDENGAPVPDDEILAFTGGYAAMPLNGIWASAPYLHNGSVPTLYHLLTGERPQTFYRLNLTYDEEHVGFTWDAADNPRAVVFDTRQAGNANTGHVGPDFNGGMDWKADPAALWDLLEYLKTR